jgi:hypothetical protein
MQEIKFNSFFFILFLVPTSYIFQDVKKIGLDEYFKKVSFNIRFLFFGIVNKRG